MNTTRKIISAIAFAPISLAIVLPVNTAAAVQLGRSIEHGPSTKYASA
jgi:hypothetical protein